MRNLLILCLFSLMFSCAKEEQQAKALQGTWKWTKSEVYIGTITPESTGMEKSLDITEEVISFYENDELIGSFDYDLSESDSLWGENSEFITYNDNKRLLTRDGEMMVLQDLCIDCSVDY